ncbi:uncharacterized protein LOC103279778 [Anolis carolinensis]|uniref:uncharacterized protein LOC103279778 n=1 Tax=Anolis carolinensis TaxID=28377 RepID=UPI002F2B6327
MALEEGDADTLKRRVVELLLQNPQGIRFENFSGAFHQLHGYYPRIALQGYHKLKELLADMKNAVVVERRSRQQVMKIAEGFCLDLSLEGEKGNGLETSEREVENLRDEDQVGGKTTLADILDWLISLLMEYKSGLRISYIKKFMLSKHAVNMEKFSIAQGYKNIMEFLEHELPKLIVRYREKPREYVVQIPEDLLDSDLSLDSDFSTSSSQSSTQDLTRTNSASSLYCTCKIDPNHVKQPTKYVPDLPAASKLIRDVLKRFPRGMKVRLLKRVLRKRRRFHLEAFCTQHGYQDVLSCLKDIPELLLLNTNRPQNCVVRLQPCHFGSDLSLDSDFSGCSSHSEPHGLTRMNSAVSLPSTSVSVLNHVKEPTNQALALPEVLSLVNNLLTKYKDGLRIKKIQDFLMATNSIDLEKFSIMQGYKGSVEFLQRQMPYLSYKKRNQGLHSIVKLGIKAKKKQSQKHPQTGTTKKNPSVASVPPLVNAPEPQSAKPLEPVHSESGFGSVSKSSVTPNDFSASKSQSQSLPLQAPSIPQEVKNMIHSSMRIPLPSFHEVHSTSPAKPNNSSQSISNSPPQKPNVCQFGGSPPMEEVLCQLDRQLSSKSKMTEDEPSKDQDDLKQQVAHILALHPEGMSLFQFRAAYSATYQQHFPMDNAASVKQRLQEMPDVVCMKSYGVQTRLLSVSCAMPSLKSGQPVSATMEKTSVVPGLSQPRTVSLTQESFEELGGDDSKEDYPVLDSLLHQVVKPRAHVQENVKKKPKSMGALVIPQPPVVCHTYAQVTASHKPLKPNSLHMKPTHLNSPYISASSASVPSYPNDPCISASSASVSSHPNDPFISASSASVPSHPNDPCISANSASVPSHPNDPCISANSASVPSHPNDSRISANSANSASVPSHPNDPYISASSTSVPSYPNDPWISANSASVPSTSHPASYNSGTWAQPVSYPFVPLVSQMPEIFPVMPAYIKVSRYPSGIQFKNPTVQSSPFAQPPHVLPIRYDPTMHLTQSIEQWSNIRTLPQVDAYSPVKTSSNILQLAQSPTSSTRRYPISPSSRNISQTVQHLESSKHTQQVGLQHGSVVVTMNKSFVVTSLDTQPKPPASAYQRQYVDWNPLASTTNTAQFISLGACSTSQPFQPLEISSNSKKNPNALLFEPPVFVDQPQPVSASATITTSSYSPPSLVDANVSPYSNHLTPSSNCNDSASQPLKPWASIQQQHTSLDVSVINSSRKQAGSLPCPQDLTIRPSRQLSITPLSVCTDNEPPIQAKPVVSFSKHADDHHVSLPINQTSYSPPNSPLKKLDSCVIL